MKFLENMKIVVKKPLTINIINIFSKNFMYLFVELFYIHITNKPPHKKKGCKSYEKEIIYCNISCRIYFKYFRSFDNGHFLFQFGLLCCRSGIKYLLVPCNFFISLFIILSDCIIEKFIFHHVTYIKSLLQIFSASFFVALFFKAACQICQKIRQKTSSSAI